MQWADIGIFLMICTRRCDTKSTMRKGTVKIGISDGVSSQPMDASFNKAELVHWKLGWHSTWMLYMTDTDNNSVFKTTPW